LERALETIDAAEIRSDLEFLASDALKGRDTPSPEQRIAARFIGARLGRLGFEPGAPDGWYWTYDMPTASIDPAASSLTLSAGEESVSLKLGEDYAFSNRGITDCEIAGADVLYGGTFSEEEREGLVIKNHWLAVRSSGLRSWDIYRAARKGRARGVLVLPGGELGPQAMDERVRSWGVSVTEGRISRRRRSSSKTLPYLYLTASAGRRLLDLAGRSAPALGDVLPVACKEVRVRREESTVGLENVVGLWPGEDPVLKNELLILSAHYDHVGVDKDGEVFNGADDNGSGTSALLALAEALKAYGPMRRTVMLMWVSGEEKGLLGSAAWTKNPYLPHGLRPVADINIDMVGRNAPRSLLITPTRDHEAYNGLTRLAEHFREREGFDELGSADAYWSRSDHANFSANLGLPVVFLFADVHEDYHKISDTVDKIDFDKIRRVGRLVLRMLDGLQTDQLDLDLH